MTGDERRRRAVVFLDKFERPDPARIAALITDDFEYELMARMTRVPTRFGREQTPRDLVGMLKAMVPTESNFRLGAVNCDGPHAAIQAQSRTVTANRRPYYNRYMFYMRFEGDRVARMSEYRDTNHVRDVFMS
jgi:ketosteroid isomerase-like protein